MTEDMQERQVVALEGIRAALESIASRLPQAEPEEPTDPLAEGFMKFRARARQGG